MLLEVNEELMMISMIVELDDSATETLRSFGVEDAECIYDLTILEKVNKHFPMECSDMVGHVCKVCYKPIFSDEVKDSFTLVKEYTFMNKGVPLRTCSFGFFLQEVSALLMN